MTWARDLPPIRHIENTVSQYKSECARYASSHNILLYRVLMVRLSWMLVASFWAALLLKSVKTLACNTRIYKLFDYPSPRPSPHIFDFGGRGGANCAGWYRGVPLFLISPSSAGRSHPLPWLAKKVSRASIGQYRPNYGSVETPT